MKSGEGPAEKQEILWEKLRRSVGKRGGHTTPVAPFWRRNELGVSADFLTGGGGGSEHAHDSRNCIEDAPSRFISSRKLAAALWELHHYKLPLDKMHHGVGVPPPRLRLHRRRHHRQQPYKDKGDVETLDHPPSSPDMPESSSNLRSHISESLMKHHQSIEKSTHAIPTVSSPSYGSSMEIAPYKPSSTVELKGRTGEEGCCLKTSTELLKVLNRIWSLEEQHVSNMSLIKSLKKELDSARSQTKELAREQRAGQYEMDELMKYIKEDKLLRKNKEQDRITAAVQSMRDEIDRERKLRLRSESLHRKLGRELCEAKTSLASFSKELERERKSRDLLENLCDEFAWEIRDYDKELHDLRQKDKNPDERGDHDQFIHHISESWLYERMQEKLQSEQSVGEKKLTINKMSSEIEAFLHSRRNSKPKINGNQVIKNPIFSRSFLESIPLNLGASAPRDEDDGDDSVSSYSNSIELEKTSEYNLQSQGNKFQENHCEETHEQEHLKKNLESSHRRSELSLSSLQVKFEEHMDQAISYEVSRNKVEDAEQMKTGQGNPGEISISKKTENFEAANDNICGQKHEYEGIAGLDTNYAIDNLIRNHYSLPFEARTKGQLSRLRLNAAIFPSRDE